jgi:hypothetical protein
MGVKEAPGALPDRAGALEVVVADGGGGGGDGGAARTAGHAPPPFRRWRPRHPRLAALRAWLLTPGFQLAAQLAVGTLLVSAFVFVRCASRRERGAAR